MINEDKWISSLSANVTKIDDKSNQTNHSMWIATIPKKTTALAAEKINILLFIVLIFLKLESPPPLIISFPKNYSLIDIEHKSENIIK